MGFSFHPNGVIAIAALLTIGLGIFYCMPSPAGPDRAMIGIVCFLAQTPRWICMAILLGFCVAKGAFVWPESRAAQYLILFAVHLAIGFGAICTGLAGLGMTSGVPEWLSRMLALSTVVVPGVQIVFAAWFLNPGLHKALDAAAMRHTTNVFLIVFAVLVGVFSLAGGAAWAMATKDTMNRHYDYEQQQKAKQRAQQEAEDSAYRALAPESPLASWMAFLEYPNSEEHQRAALDAILRRPKLRAELSELIGSGDERMAIKAMYFVGQMFPAPVEVADAVREQARLVTRIAEEIDPTSPESRNVLYGKVHARAHGILAAAHGLYRAHVDLRPELRAMAEACGPREQAPPRDIKSGCDQIIHYFELLQGTGGAGLTNSPVHLTPALSLEERKNH
jgi:hypothetical protein